MFSEEVTDEFVEEMENGPFTGWLARLVAKGYLPKSINEVDPRVIEIVRKCREANPDSAKEV